MRQIKIRRPLCLISLVFSGFMYVFLILTGGVDIEEHIPDNRKVTLVGTIYNKSNKGGENILYLREVDMIYGPIENASMHCCNRLRIKLSPEDVCEYKIGQSIKAYGSYKNFNIPQNEGEFNSRKYYRIHEIEGSVENVTVIEKSKKYSGLHNALFRIKEITKEIYESCMTPLDAGTMEALVLGDKDLLDAEEKELYQDAGIAHILSLSGLHIATVGLCLYSFLRKIGISIKGSSGISALIMTMYGIITGLSTSTIRALIMFVLGIIAKSIGRTYDLMSAVSLSAILILIENPLYIFDSGFLMSVLAVTGIGVIYPILCQLLGDGIMQHGEKAWNSLCISISASLATLPVSMSSFYKVALYGPIVNIIVVPLVAVILAIGLFVGVMGNVMVLFEGIIHRGVFRYAGVDYYAFITSHGGLHKCIALALKPTSIVLALYRKIAGFSSSIKGNVWITGKPAYIAIVGYIILLCAAVLFWKMSVNQKLWIKKSVTFILLVASIACISVRNYPKYEIDVLSVGQGACNVIYGKDTPTIMIDNGSSDRKKVFKYTVEPFLLSKGIGKLDQIYITHPDADHVSGIKEMLEDGSDIEVGHVFMSINDDNIREMVDIKSEENRYHVINRGNVVDAGGIRIECISPVDKGLKDWDAADGNEESLVLKVTHKESGYTALFTGDISSETEERIISSKSSADKISSVDFMTIPHHGSRFSSSDKFLSVTNPKICTISAGENNSYGHPHKETLERLEKNIPAAKVLRTDECGQVTVSIGKNIAVKQFRRK